MRFFLIAVILSVIGTFAQDINFEVKDTLKLNPEFIEYSEKRVKHFTTMRNVGIVLTGSGIAAGVTGISIGTKYGNEAFNDKHHWDNQEDAIESSKKSNELLRKQNIWHSVGISGSAIAITAIPMVIIGANETKWRREGTTTEYQKKDIYYTKIRNIGTGLTIGGTILGTISTIFWAKNTNIWTDYADAIYAFEGLYWVINETTGKKYTRKEFDAMEKRAYEARDKLIAWGTFGFIGGGVALTGIPLAIIGGAEAKCWKKMFAIHIAPNGVDFVWNF
ncbi:MAG: hypothetical protein LBH98_04585 [Chitinispirillales bacterium]|jgi:hypothetical protein|nr:hypothetical protein [Chitinispirillales bacterium]